MNDPSETSSQPTSPAIDSFMPSAESQFGPARCATLDGATAIQSTVEAVRASRFLLPVSVEENPMIDTFGPNGSDSSEPVALQSSSESKSPARTDTAGSTELRKTLEALDTTSQPPSSPPPLSVPPTDGNGSTSLPSSGIAQAGLFQERLSEALKQRLQDLGSTLYSHEWKTKQTPQGRPVITISSVPKPREAPTAWPTPVKEDARSSARHGYMIEGNAGTTLLDAARLTSEFPAAYPTPQAHDHATPKTLEQIEEMRARAPKRSSGGPPGISNLNEVVTLMRPSPYATPAARDFKGEFPGHTGGMGLSAQVKLMEPDVIASGPSGWATPASHEAGGTPERFLERKRLAKENGSKLGISLTSLSLQAQMTEMPSEEPTELTETLETTEMTMSSPRHWYEEQLVIPETLERTASDPGSGSDSKEILPGEELLAASGPKTSNGSTAGRSRGTKTGAGGQLNAVLSRWLQGLPPIWDELAPHGSAVSATRSSSPSRGPSSKR